MQTVIKLTNSNSSRLPSEFDSDDVRFSDSLVEYFINAYTKEGDVVFDPFAGFGTTLIVAEAMNRVPSGVEFILERVQYMKKQLKNPSAVIHGDSRRLSEFNLPSWNPPAGNPAACGGEEGRSPGHENSSSVTTMISDVWVE